MKCPNCGKDITEDSQYCEYCGERLNFVRVPPDSFSIEKNRLSLVAIIAVIVILGGGIMCLIITDSSASYEVCHSTSPAADNCWIDLGLPSGTMWKNKNEEGGYYTYKEAKQKFGNSLPTKKQCEELINSCVWSWSGNGYQVTGPNGNAIFMPAMGYREYDGSIYFVGESASYWSSTLFRKDAPWSLRFYFNPNSNDVDMGYGGDYAGYTVRLVN